MRVAVTLVGVLFAVACGAPPAHHHAVAPGDVVVDDACPDGVICVDALPYGASGSTVDGAQALDQYSCAPTKDESGPERVYRVALPSAGTLTVSLDASLEAGAVDVDVHILSAFDAG